MPGQWRHALPEAGVDGSHPTAHLHLPSPQKSGSPSSGAAVRGIHSLFHAQWVCAEVLWKGGCWGGGGEALPLFKDTQKEGVLAMLWTPAMNSRVLPAVLQDWKGTSLPWRGAETEVGGAFRAQRAVKW